jgi:ABC transporter substrate binding protein
MRRREFIGGLGSAAACPLSARAQQGSRARRIGVLMSFDENDLGVQAWLAALTQGLAELGWSEGRNVRIDVRWADVDFDRMRMFAKELIDLRPDVIVVSGFPATRVLQQQTQTIPIIVMAGGDPVTAGLVGSISRPDGNITGFPSILPSMGGKWLELLKEAVQIGRVDRKGSLWEKLTNDWIKGGAEGPPSFIEVRQLVFEGTYDAFQWDRVRRRQHVFDASLFGSLLPMEAWERVPVNRLPDLRAAAPSFSPMEER